MDLSLFVYKQTNKNSFHRNFTHETPIDIAMARNVSQSHLYLQGNQRNQAFMFVFKPEHSAVQNKIRVLLVKERMDIG